MRDAPAGLMPADVGVQLLDAFGDGRTDLLVTRDRLDGYFPLRFDPDEAGWDRGSFRAYRQAPSFDLHSSDVRLLRASAADASVRPTAEHQNDKRRPI
jgi:hypothetical protein